MLRGLQTSRHSFCRDRPRGGQRAACSLQCASGARVRVGADGDAEVRIRQTQRQSETPRGSKLVVVKSRVKGFVFF